jgi:hypothetical protein
MAPKIPSPKLNSPTDFTFWRAGVCGRVGAAALGAGANGGGALTAGGTAELIRSPGTGATVVVADGLERFCARILLADCVPSTPQAGQFTLNGITPLTGSTSNLYFWPQLQTTFNSIKFLSDLGASEFEKSNYGNKICPQIFCFDFPLLLSRAAP